MPLMLQKNSVKSVNSRKQGSPRSEFERSKRPAIEKTGRLTKDRGMNIRVRLPLKSKQTIRLALARRIPEKNGESELNDSKNTQSNYKGRY